MHSKSNEHHHLLHANYVTLASTPKTKSLKLFFFFYKRRFANSWYLACFGLNFVLLDFFFKVAFELCVCFIVGLSCMPWHTEQTLLKKKCRPLVLKEEESVARLCFLPLDSLSDDGKLLITSFQNTGRGPRRVRRAFGAEVAEGSRPTGGYIQFPYSIHTC